jgi:hypothetical protein
MYIYLIAKPTTMTGIMGSGKELHIPKNLSDMAALAGMPEEHKKRTVSKKLYMYICLHVYVYLYKFIFMYMYIYMYI